MFRVSTRDRTNDSPHDHLQYGTRNGWCGITTATTIVRIWSKLDRRRTRNNVLIGLVTDHFVVRGEFQRCHDRHRGRTTLSICRHTNDIGGYDAMSQCISDERKRVLVNKGDTCVSNKKAQFYIGDNEQCIVYTYASNSIGALAFGL